MKFATKILKLLGLALALNGCGTVTPNNVNDDIATSDASTPSQYGDAGWLIWQKPNGDGVITKSARARYNALISQYVAQFYLKYAVQLVADGGVTPFNDVFDNELYLIDAEHLEYFARLSEWKKKGVEPDSTWIKIKNAVSP